MELLIRPAAFGDLEPLRQLYTHLHPNDEVLSDIAAIQGWEAMLAQPGFTCIVGVLENQLVASCCLAVIPNLTRGGRPYALIENVVTHGAFRRRGFGRAVLAEALALAWAAKCHKAMLLTGSKLLETRRFYEACGFRSDDKTGYVARPN